MSYIYSTDQLHHDLRFTCRKFRISRIGLTVNQPYQQYLFVTPINKDFADILLKQIINRLMFTRHN